jgi:hypothetical protein
MLSEFYLQAVLLDRRRARDAEFARSQTLGECPGRKRFAIDYFLQLKVRDLFEGNESRMFLVQ